MASAANVSMSRSIPIIDFADYQSKDENRVNNFIKNVGDSLKDIGFFALKNHGIPIDLIKQSYDRGDDFFGLSAEEKANYAQKEIAHQRGYTAFGVEHAKDNPAPDLKEFWQTGRTHKPGESPSYPANVWPDDSVPKFKETVDDLYNRMEALSCDLLSACSIYLGKDGDW